MNTFAINWETGEFIFCAHKDENEKGEIVPFPKDIDLIELMKVIPETTNSVLGTGKKYRDYSFDDLRKMGVNNCYIIPPCLWPLIREKTREIKSGNNL